jgi:hypothetical protein
MAEDTSGGHFRGAETPRRLLAYHANGVAVLSAMVHAARQIGWQVQRLNGPFLSDGDEQVDSWLAACERLGASLFLADRTFPALTARMGEFAQRGCQLWVDAPLAGECPDLPPLTQWLHELPASAAADQAPKAGATAGEWRWCLPNGTLFLRQVGGDWPIDRLVDVAARRNSTRGYLLVSRVLGKHLPVTPERMHTSHEALAAQLPPDLPGPVLFVGMGETATGLGWGVWQAWASRYRRHDVLYVHSTRYPLDGCETVAFEEGHSHGPAQVVCVPETATLRAQWQSAKTLVVVDDELTTGATAVDLANALARAGLDFTERHAVTLVATESQELRTRFGGDGGWRLHALANVETDWQGDGALGASRVPQGLTPLTADHGNRSWGRAATDHPPIMPAAVREQLARLPRSRWPVYMVAAGECMYPALEAGRLLASLGHRVLLQSSTRSPVQLGNAIRLSLPCEDGLGSGVAFFTHNPPPVDATVVVLHERGGEAALTTWQAYPRLLPLLIWGG